MSRSGRPDDAAPAPRHPWVWAVLYSLFSLLALGAAGCAVFGGDEEHVFGRASLSDAANRAKPDSSKTRSDEVRERKKPLDVGWTVEPYEPSTSTSLEVSQGSSQSPRESDSNPGGSGEVIGVVMTGGSLGGASYDGFGLGGIDIGFYATPRFRVDIAGFIGGLNMTGTSLQGQAFRNEVELAADASARYYLSPPHTFMSAYPIAGVRLGTLFWDYAKPIDVTENGQPKSVSSDRIDFMSIYCGAGVSLMQLRHMHVGVQATAGVKLYAPDSHEGFSNDLFPDAGFGQLSVEAMYKF